jgi:hypothetical protein
LGHKVILVALFIALLASTAGYILAPRLFAEFTGEEKVRALTLLLYAAAIFFRSDR